MTEKKPLKSQEVSGKKWILFDGSCGLCHWSVRFITPKDLNKSCCFVPLNSPLGIQLLKERGLYFPKDINATLPLNSVILIDPIKGYYIKSEAVIQILKLLPSWHFIGVLMQYIPSKISDSFYDYLAKNRTKWFGTKLSCKRSDLPKNTCFKTEI